MQLVAVGWLALELTGSPFFVGLVTSARALPIVLLVLPVGMLADRVDRRWLIIAASLLAMASSGMLALLAIQGSLTIGWLLGLAVLTGVANAIEVPTFNAFLGQMAGRDRLARAIGLNSVVFNLARLGGPALAGMLIATAGAAVVFAINALSYLPLICGLLIVGARPGRRSGLGLTALRQALAFVGQAREVRLLLWLLAANSVLVTAFIVLAPAVSAGLGAGAPGTGFLLSAAGAGALIAGGLVAWLGNRSIRLLLASGVCVGLGQLVVGLAPVLLVGMVGMALAGGGMVAFSAISNARIQGQVPEELRGRVMSLYALAVPGLAPLAGVLVGSAAAVGGTAATLAVGALAWLVILLLPGRQVRRPQLERAGV